MDQIPASEAFRRHLREVRGKMSQAELVNRLVALGYVVEDAKTGEKKPRLSRAAISEIERGVRRVTIDDWLAISAAVGVAPIHMIVPFETDDPVESGFPGDYVVFPAKDELKVGDALVLIPIEARRWIKGLQIHHGADPHDQIRYESEHVPPNRKWELERTRAKREGREPGPKTIPESKASIYHYEGSQR